jgi:hypothetical protein
MKGFKNLSVKEVTDKELAEISEALGKSRAEIISEFVQCLHAILAYSKSPSIGYVLSPLEGSMEIKVYPRKQWVLVRKRIHRDMAKKQVKGD